MEDRLSLSALGLAVLTVVMVLFAATRLVAVEDDIRKLDGRLAAVEFPARQARPAELIEFGFPDTPEGHAAADELARVRRDIEMMAAMQGAISGVTGPQDGIPIPTNHADLVRAVARAMVVIEDAEYADFAKKHVEKHRFFATQYADRIVQVTGLEKEQEEKVLAIIREQVDAYYDIWVQKEIGEAEFKRADEIDALTDTKILSLLKTPEQQKKYEKARRPWLRASIQRSGKH